MIINLRDAKARLSELVNPADGGEEILITVHGEPKARLVLIIETDPNVSAWMEELTALRASHKTAPASAGPSALDEVREDRW